MKPDEPESSQIFRKNTQTLCSKVMKSSARGLRDFPAIFAEPLWDDSGSGRGAQQLIHLACSRSADSAVEGGGGGVDITRAPAAGCDITDKQMQIVTGR